MHEAWEAFKECGWAAWLCVLIAMPALAAGVVGLALRGRHVAGRVLGILAIALGVTTIAVGFAGRELGIATTEAALSGAGIDPAQKARIREVGRAEAGQCVAVGGAMGALPFVLGVIALALGMASRDERASAGSA
jgi:hypothetical protein